MDFFNSLYQISKNSGNFKKWEENQKDETAKREELYNRRKYSDEEIARAKALGENIIDVIDIMDNHSESVAENVETATQPIVALSPYLGMGAAGGAVYNTIYKPNLKKYQDFRKEFFDSEEFKNFKEKYHDLGIKNGKRSFYWAEGLITDKKSIEKNIHDAELKKEALRLYNKYKKGTAFYKRGNILSIAVAAAGAIASFVGINIYAAKLQVDSSKIARYQARESLNNPKYFVDYTPEQIAKAKEEIDKHPELRKAKKKEKLDTGFFKSIINLFKDRKAYLNSVKNDTDESKIVTRELTSDEIIKAKQDKEVIQRTVRVINNEAEKYSQNMEVAAEVLINGTPFLGAAIGGGIGWILNKLGVIEKFVDKNVEKNGSDKTKELYADLKKGKESGKSVISKWIKFNQSFFDDLRNSENQIITEGKNAEELKEVKKAAKKAPKDIVKEMKRFIVSAFAHPVGKNWIIGGVGAVITGIAGAFIGLKLQKSAARAGRYTAKRELEKDPKNFIGYTEDDYNEVKDVKSSKKSESKIKEVITFLPKTIKQYFEYEKYKKNEYKEKQLLQEQLIKQEVSDKQMKDAKNLQRKLFNTFEKVDDNSQTYSESMEAAIDIAQPFVMYAGILTMISPLIYYGVQTYRGKITPAKILNKFAGFMNKSSERMKSKWFKKYLKNVAENVGTKVQDTQVSSKPLGVLMGGIHLKNDSIYEIVTKLWKNIQGSTAEIAKMDKHKQWEEIFKLQERINNSLKMKDPELAKAVQSVFDRILYEGNPQSRADALNIIVNPQSIKDMPTERYKEATQLINSVVNSITHNKHANGHMWEQIKEVAEQIKPDKLNNMVNLGENPDIQRTILKELEEIKSFKFKDIIERIPAENRSPKTILNNFKTRLSALSDDDFAREMERLNLERLGMDKKTMLEIIPKLEKILENIPKEEMSAIQNKIIDEFCAHPDEFIKLLSSGKIGSILVTPGLKKALAAAGISWAAFTLVMTYAIEAWLADIQLKAGRLGVMKAIEGLDDYRYYANVEKDESIAMPNQTAEQETQSASSENQVNSNLLAKLKQ